ncbi:membrane associated erythrocyte binding-like protein [Plasmodium berghei ANKA]|uniref:Membrane associated erythrocyte binding-like protein n=1 Tax=Plasmodium berghei (strain Anka) TaxID=5823 RepID=A0A509ALI8_PLABA|nr:membrane associated erythrocyte binding-like protein [Plasmodium berghei ANKA]VUC55554.1 membrane associated erythrocyte binding-like protein [Plasmodium berghei ANKA]|eukprot:XP_034421364.1 membrane associated erythrocyte binding-like protein [Plasmodium berghei ANKA]
MKVYCNIFGFCFFISLWIPSIRGIDNPQEDFMDRFDILNNHVNIKWTNSGSLGKGDFKFDIYDEDNINSKFNTLESAQLCSNHENDGIYRGSCPDYGKTFSMNLDKDEYNEDFLNEISLGLLNKKLLIDLEIPVNMSGLAMYQGLFANCPYDKNHANDIKNEKEYDMCFDKFYRNKQNISTRIKKQLLISKYTYFGSHGLGGRLGSNTEYPLHIYNPIENYKTKQMRYPKLVETLEDCSIYSHCIGPCFDRDFDNKCFRDLPVAFNHKTKECIIIGTHEEKKTKNCNSDHSRNNGRCFSSIKKEKGKDWTYVSSFLRPDYETKCPPRYPLNNSEFGYFNYNTGKCESPTKLYDNTVISFNQCIEKLFSFNYANENPDQKRSNYLWGVWVLENKQNKLNSMNDLGVCVLLKERPTCVLKKQNYYSFTNLTANYFDNNQNIEYPDIENVKIGKNRNSELSGNLTYNDKKFKNSNINKGMVISMNDISEIKENSKLQTNKRNEGKKTKYGLYNYPITPISYLQINHKRELTKKYMYFENSLTPSHNTGASIRYEGNNRLGIDANNNRRNTYGTQDINLKRNNNYKQPKNKLNPQAEYMDRFDIEKNHIYIDWKQDGKYGSDKLKYNIISHETANTVQSLLITDKNDICPNHYSPGRAQGSCPNYGKSIIVKALEGTNGDEYFNLNFLNEIRTGYLNRYMKYDVELPYEKSGLAMHHGDLNECPKSLDEENLYKIKSDYNYGMCKSTVLKSNVPFKTYNYRTKKLLYFGLYGLGGRLGSNMSKIKNIFKSRPNNITLPMFNPSLIKNLLDCSLYSYCLGPCLENAYNNKCFRNLPAYFNHETKECVILGTHEQERVNDCRKRKEDINKPNCQDVRKTPLSKDWTYVTSFIRPDYEEKCPPRYPLKFKSFGKYDEATGKCKSLINKEYIIDIPWFASCLEYMFIMSPDVSQRSEKKRYWGVWIADKSVNSSNLDEAKGKCYYITEKPNCVIDKVNHFSFTSLTTNDIDFDQNINLEKLDELVINNDQSSSHNRAKYNKPIGNYEYTIVRKHKSSPEHSSSVNTNSYTQNRMEEKFAKEIDSTRSTDRSRMDEVIRVREEAEKNAKIIRKFEELRIADMIKKRKEAGENAEEVKKAEEERKRIEAAKKVEEERKKAEAAKKAEEERKRIEEAKKVEEKRKKDEAAKKAEEKRKKDEAAKKAEEKRKKDEAAKKAEEKRKKDEAAKKAEEERKRIEEAKKVEEKRKKDEAAKKAEEKRKKDEAAKKAEEKRKKDEAAKKVEEERKRIEEAKKVEEKRKKDEAAKKAEEKRKKDEAAKKAEEKRKKDEAAKKAEEKRKKAEAAKKAEEKRKKDEAAKKAEEKRKKDEAAKKVEEERKKAEEAKKAEEERKRIEEAKKVEEKRKKDEAAKKVEEERKKAEAAKKAEEERKRIEEAKKAEEERKRIEEAKKVEEKRKKDEAAKKAEEERKRIEAAKKVEEERKRIEEAKKAEEERKRIEEAKKAEEERKRIEEAKKVEEKRKKDEAAKKAEEERKRIEAAKKVEEERKRIEEAKKAEEERKRIEEAKKVEEKRKKDEEAKKAEEERKRIETAKKVEEERKKAEAAKKAEEERKRIEAAKKVEEERKRIEAAKKAEEERKRIEEAKKAEEERKRIETAKKVEEERKKAEAAKKAEEERKRIEAAKKVEEERKRIEAAKKAEEERKRIEEAKKAEEEIKKDSNLAEKKISSSNYETRHIDDNSFKKLDEAEYKSRNIDSTRNKIISMSKENMCINDISSKYCDYMKDKISSGSCSNDERKQLCCSISDYCLNYFDYNSNKYYDCTKREFSDPLYKCFSKEEYSITFFYRNGLFCWGGNNNVHPDCHMFKTYRRKMV